MMLGHVHAFTNPMEVGAAWLYPVGPRLKGHAYSADRSFTRLLSSSHLFAACLSTMCRRPDSRDTQLTRCFSCQCLEFDWRGYRDGLCLNVADVYTCSKCKDLDYLESQRYSFLNLSQHLTSTLRLLILLPFLSDYLYPLSLRHKHTRTQRLRTLQLFLQGLSAWKTTSTTYLI